MAPYFAGSKPFGAVSVSCRYSSLLTPSGSTSAAIWSRERPSGIVTVIVAAGGLAGEAVDRGAVAHARCERVAVGLDRRRTCRRASAATRTGGRSRPRPASSRIVGDLAGARRPRGSRPRPRSPPSPSPAKGWKKATRNQTSRIPTSASGQGERSGGGGSCPRRGRARRRGRAGLARRARRASRSARRSPAAAALGRGRRLLGGRRRPPRRLLGGAGSSAGSAALRARRLRALRTPPVLPGSLLLRAALAPLLALAPAPLALERGRVVAAELVGVGCQLAAGGVRLPSASTSHSSRSGGSGAPHARRLRRSVASRASAAR